MSINTEAELEGMRRVGRVVGLTLRAMKRAARPGMTTAELDAVGARVLAEHGARSAPRLVYGFPGVNLISVNDEAVHGIPGERVLRAGDLVALDVTAELDGFIADAALTIPLPPVRPVHRELLVCAKSAFRKAAGAARAGEKVNRIGQEMEREVRRSGFRVIRELASHGVGRSIHEWPSVPNYYEPRLRDRLTDGLVITIEPIIAAGTGRVYQDTDGWTIRTADRSLSAHYEQTVLITKGRPVLLTTV
jgi:methionyl aminopeptidase